MDARETAVKDKKWIYLVYGESGEYEERQDWVICAYRNEKKAKKHAENAQQRVDEIKDILQSVDLDDWLDKKDELIKKEGNKYDPQMNDERTVYRYYAVELL